MLDLAQVRATLSKRENYHAKADPLKTKLNAYSYQLYRTWENNGRYDKV